MSTSVERFAALFDTYASGTNLSLWDSEERRQVDRVWRDRSLASLLGTVQQEADTKLADRLEGTYARIEEYADGAEDTFRSYFEDRGWDCTLEKDVAPAPAVWNGVSIRWTLEPDGESVVAQVLVDAETQEVSLEFKRRIAGGKGSEILAMASLDLLNGETRLGKAFWNPQSSELIYRYTYLSPGVVDMRVFERVLVVCFMGMDASTDLVRRMAEGRFPEEDRARLIGHLENTVAALKG